MPDRSRSCRRRIAIALAWLGIGLTAMPSGATGAELSEQIDRLLPEMMRRHEVPGVTLAVVRDGRLVLSRGYGQADLDRGVAVDASRTVFPVASVSKVVTATALMQLRERGRLALHVDVNRYLRDFAVPEVFGEPITTAHLLTHTAGFDESNLGRYSFDEAALPELSSYLARELPPRIRPPGRVWQYSNHGLALAGHLVEAIEGVPFSEYVELHLLQPLEMTRSSYGHPLGELAVGYDRRNGSLRPLAPHVIKTIPASMLRSTADDMAHFMLMHLNQGRFRGRRLLRPSTLSEMHRSQFRHHPRVPAMAYGFFEDETRGERTLSHRGQTRGFSAALVLFPDRSSGYFVAYNRHVNALSRELDETLVELLVPQPAPESRELHPLPGGPGRAKRVQGFYRYNRYAHRSPEKLPALLLGRAPVLDVRAQLDGALLIDGERYAELEPWLYRGAESEAPIGFLRDGDAEVTHLFLGRNAYERIPGWQTDSVVHAAFGLLVLFYLISLGSRFVFRSSRSGGGLRGARALETTLGAVNLSCLLGVLVTIVAVHSRSIWNLLSEVPWYIAVIWGLPLISGLLTPFLLYKVAGAWIMRRGALRARMNLTFSALMALFFLSFACYWNLLEFSSW